MFIIITAIRAMVDTEEDLKLGNMGLSNIVK